MASDFHIGTHHAGRSDLFGPLVVAALVFTDSERERTALGRPPATDAELRVRATSVRSAFFFRVVEIGPARYNELREHGAEPDRLLNWAHARAITALFQYGYVTTTVVLDARLDLSYVRSRVQNRLPELPFDFSVGSCPAAQAAYIIARDHYLGWLSRTSTELKVRLEPGSSAEREEVTGQIVARFGEGKLRAIAKLA